MKPVLSMAVILTLACGAVADDAAELGKVVGDITLKDLSGKEIKLSELRKSEKDQGKIVLVHFWSYKCPAGKKIMDEVKKLTEKCEKEGIVFIGVCAYGESEADLKKYAESNGLKYMLCHDAEKKGAKHFGAKVITTSYVLDREGKLVYRGGWEKALDAAMATKEGKEVSEKETPAKG